MGDVVAAGAWSGRSVLVTGAAGFLGEWTVRTLAAGGARVAGLDIAWRPEQRERRADTISIVDGDVRDIEGVAALLRDARVDAVVHLAAQSLVGEAQTDPVDAFSNNVEGTWAVLEACRRTPAVASIVVASSDKAYGDAKGEEYDETMPLTPLNPYDVSKACADLIARSYASAYGLPIAVTRCGNIYGGGDLNWSRVVPGTVRSLLRGERPIIRSDGTYVRDYLYVEDAVAGVLTLASALAERAELRGEAFNFAAGERHTVMEVVERIMNRLGIRLEPDVRNEAVGEIREQRLSAAKAQAVLGWRPAYSLDEGLNRAATWYREYLGSAR
ncbi:MAG: NAD-dependent epimerase/dehydratase family protein [Actinomycetota bacterium]